MRILRDGIRLILPGELGEQKKKPEKKTEKKLTAAQRKRVQELTERVTAHNRGLAYKVPKDAEIRCY